MSGTPSPTIIALADDVARGVRDLVPRGAEGEHRWALLTQLSALSSERASLRIEERPLPTTSHDMLVPAAAFYRRLRLSTNLRFVSISRSIYSSLACLSCIESRYGVK